LIAVVALLAHAPSLFGGFIWLDHAHIEAGAALSQKVGWLELFTGGFADTGFYRPLVALTLSLEHALGAGALLHHAVNLALHAMVAVAVAASAELFGLSALAALLAGLIFAVHPVASLVAGAIAFRSEAMVALSLLGLLRFHARGQPILRRCVSLSPRSPRRQVSSSRRCSSSHLSSPSANEAPAQRRCVVVRGADRP
jgi:protein O-mannosyl-transferase